MAIYNVGVILGFTPILAKQSKVCKSQHQWLFHVPRVVPGLGMLGEVLFPLK